MKALLLSCLAALAMLAACDSSTNPCPTGLCTPVGGGDRGSPAEAGRSMSCGRAYPVECGTDAKCAAERLCGSAGGTVSVATCYYTCAYR